MQHGLQLLQTIPRLHLGRPQTAFACCKVPAARFCTAHSQPRQLKHACALLKPQLTAVTMGSQSMREFTKVVIRQLPPTLQEADCKAALDKEFADRYNWFSFLRGKIG